jgi:hypothetical protein
MKIGKMIADSYREEKTLDNIVLFPRVVEHPGAGIIKLVGFKRPYKHLPGVYAYVDAETGEYSGMLLEDETIVKVIE